MARKQGRRGNGEGSISERSDGRWQAQITLPDGSRRTAYAKTQKEAITRLDELRAEAKRAGRLLPSTGYRTLSEFFAAWLSTVDGNREANTYRFYRQNLRLYCEDLMHVAPAKLTPQHLQKLLANLAAQPSQHTGKPLSATTINLVCKTLHAAFAFGVDQGVWDRNLMDRVRRPKKRRYEHTTLNATQLRKLLAELEGHRLYALFVLVTATGMRPGEIFGLRWRDVDVSTGEIQLQRNLQRVDGVTFSKDPKSESGRRHIMIRGMALEALRAHKSRQEVEKTVLANQWETTRDLVFCTLKGRPLISTNVVVGVFKPALRRAGLPDMRFYDLRHSAATALFEEGVHPSLVAALLGHSSITLTLGTYTHVLPHMLTQVADIMDGLLFGQEKP
jgi:integrase